ncbi:C4-dicarboxylate transport sensor protein DctB [Brucella endophytica]|uniref:histidine kinase n=1 Tax=Brucella endophytica TaxID=1963359 RepID=A0A916RZF4_9HYPH|nr:ATP-binding protein [Brucella endophytica]GGA77406.1 C4-dicarboxylate transport sensor protein DctB [Brucella endophytica]
MKTSRHHPAIEWSIFALLAAGLLLAALWLAGDYGRAQAYRALDSRSRNAASLNAVVLRTVLEKQRSVPFVLAQDRDIRAALASGDKARFQELDHKLEGLVDGTGASVIYILNRHGLAVAASNWRSPTSFVGNDYAFRPYYREAVKSGRAEYYALGTASLRPGLYISRRVEGPHGLLGVIVVKLVFDQVEADWRSSADASYVTDEHGVVLVTSIPRWRFRTLTDIPPKDQTALRDTLQFGDAPLTVLPISPHFAADERPDIVRAALPDTRPARFVRVRVPVPTTNWTLHMLAPASEEVALSMREARSLAVLGLIPVLALAGWLLRRRQRIQRRAAQARLAREELETRVSERTFELSAANKRLEREVEERQKTVLRLQEVREELAQANRLAILGQVAAGITHEINQPVAAIRSYADNARTFLARNDRKAVGENLSTIAALTERIGTIADGLRTFSRKGTGGVEPTSVAAAMDGAFLLLNNRLRQQGVEFVCDIPPPDIRVMGNRVRLEQVLVNLMQNAMEAMEGQADGRVELSWERQGDETHLIVADNGPGIPHDIMERLFTPFTTTKKGGLGLGHVICNDIVTEFGGRLEVESEPGQGTRFIIHLKSVL